MSSVDPRLSIDARPHFLLALRRVLRPVVRLMVRYGIRYDEFADVARTAYIESAAKTASDEVTQSSFDQIEWATGINRAQIEHRIYAADEPLEPAPLLSSTRMMAELLHKWHTTPRYLDSDGSPLDLEFDSASGEPTFSMLVAEVNVDADPRIILDGLLDSKCVAYFDDNRIKVLTRTLIWAQGGVRSIDYFGVNLSRMIETLEHNLTSTDADRKRLERSVFADRGIPTHLVSEFHAFATERATQFLYDLDDWLAQHEMQRNESNEPFNDVGVNLFFYLETPRDSRPLSALVKPARLSTSCNSASADE